MILTPLSPGPSLNEILLFADPCIAATISCTFYTGDLFLLFMRSSWVLLPALGSQQEGPVGLRAEETTEVLRGWSSCPRLGWTGLGTIWTVEGVPAWQGLEQHHL